MRLLEVLATAFINTFGITQPTELQKRQASWFIAVLLAFTVLAVAGVGYAFFLVMRR